MIELGGFMKIVISPSKTMRRVSADRPQKCLFQKEKETLLGELRNYTVEALEKLYQSSRKIAEENHRRFSHFEENSKALWSYTGAQFKALDINSLSASSRDFLDQHLFIMSGLYGLLRPSDTIGLYRLPMNVEIGRPLKDYWREPLYNTLENQTVLNLASKEYSETLDARLTIITVDFFTVDARGKHKKNAMEVKQQRGQYLRYLASEKSLSETTLKSYCENGYQYQETLSDKNKIIYTKRT